MDDVRTRSADAVPGVRLVDDAATFKAMADPLRLAMLRRMMAAGVSENMRPWTAKELAAELGEPQTKLYRHLKQLEECGLIRVVETRLVSGIVEQRYAAAQTSMEIKRDFLEQSTTRDETADLFAAGIDTYRRGLLAAVHGGRIDLKAEPEPGASYRRPLLMFGDVRLSPARADEFRRRLSELLDEYVSSDGRIPSYQEPDGVELSVMLGCFTEIDGAG
ncbi:helix-turn-helix domain-containing protein [Streptacidiphilus sp. PB12-B1b]|uniref:helix-turn-helix domain-containing protein n=1 Tax=Streptacidiphilus sp. PB12-B1b TaxID=2705012 RepID=UPI0015FDF3A9|nr:helix-turn-helix domain-containing protein [Streptacidiphilus sp. PB12-B1b]QMU75446.1 helix-turn-helix domain-containing protein [Streptacidiphilus sp. PB12-B1b]